MGSMENDKYCVCVFYRACSEEHLNEEISVMEKYGWSDYFKVGLKNARDQFLLNGSIETPTDIAHEILKRGIIERYAINSISQAFADFFANGLTIDPKNFKPYPFLGTLRCKTTSTFPADQYHYLHLTGDLNSVLLQLWFYCDQNELIFRKAGRRTWEDYAQLTKFEEGWAGASERIAWSLRRYADEIMGKS